MKLQEELRIIQYNLQVKDTLQMVPEEIAGSVERAGANAVVLNVGGIYAWYDSKVPFHHINEYLPDGEELLEKILECCHRRDIAVIGRFDFSKAEDVAYLQHPEWFVQTVEGRPVAYGSGRMGGWSLLFSTCINGGYRNEEFAVPVLEEAMEKLELDGIFFNAPHMERCHCERCRRKYKEHYGEELPPNPEDWHDSWASECLRDNMDLLYRTVKKKRPDMPVILYYGTYRQGKSILPENLDQRYATADFICTEAQDILSAGKKALPDIWKPTLNMKLGSCVQGRPKPFGIIHSCPGMDWRHTGLPAAEYEFWMSQIPAAGGLLWHSLTGFEATIPDKREMKTVERVNRKAQKAAEHMRGAKQEADVLLLWNAGVSEQGYVEGLMKGHIPFSVMDVWHLEPEKMAGYPLVIVPDGFWADEKTAALLLAYVKQGGSVLLEKTDEQGMNGLDKLLGISPDVTRGRMLEAAYGRMEDGGACCRKNLEDTVYIPVKGDVLYVRKIENARALMTLVPPFAPLDGVGAPPERASLPVVHTQLPLLLENRIGKGNVIGCFFSLSGLMRTVGLGDVQQLFENCVRYLLEENRHFDGSELETGIFAYHWADAGHIWIHLINGIGERPLRTSHICREVKFKVRVEGRVKSVRSVLEESDILWEQTQNWVSIQSDRLAVWDMIEIERG